MPTKPLTTPLDWATNALYTTGPFIGSASKVAPGAAVAAEGHRPGSLFPTPAEYENYQQNRLTAWVTEWVAVGTFNPDANAHIVETDSTGRAGVHGLDVIDTVDETAVVITGVNTLAPTVTATCTTGAVVIASDVGNSTGTAFSASVGTGAGTGLDATLSATAAGGAGVRISTTGVTAADGIVVTSAAGHVGDGAVIDVSAGGGVGITVRGSNAASAIDATAAGNQSAGTFTGSGLGSGVVATSGGTNGAVGVTAESVNNTGFGVQATVPVAATAAAAAVRAAGRGSGQGITASAVSGAAASLSASNVAGVCLFLTGKAGDPSTITNGCVDYNTNTKTIVTANNSDAAYRDVQTALGNACRGGTTGNVAQTLGGAIWVTAATFTLSAGEIPLRAGRTLRIRFRCDARMTVAAQGTLNVRIRDTTNAVTLVTRAGAGIADNAGYFLAVASTAWQRSVILDYDYSPCPTGAITFVAEIQTGTADNVRVRDASLLPEGLF